ncbi:MAG: hypothetical protein JEY97_00760 [Bacteroidales bacterium]|nr:hypothetical protein [Bacteroidales bacterium]
MKNLYKIFLFLLILLSSTVTFSQTNKINTQKNSTSPRTEIAPILLSATPGIEEIRLEWKAIPENGKTNQTHFGIEDEHWTISPNPSGDTWDIYIGNARFDAKDMEAGDEIAIFDGDLVVGVLTLTEVRTPDNQLSNPLIAFELLQFEPGYAAGSPFTLKAYDKSQHIESIGFEYTFSNPWGDAYTGDVFPYGNAIYSLAELEFTSGIYIPEFNIYYEDGTLVAAEIEGTSYADKFLFAGQEYSYYITQILESGMESNPSKVLCAIPAQQPFGVIDGEITNGVDPLKGAIITIEGTEYIATTNKYGEYFIKNVEPGVYHIKANAEGFKTEIQYYSEVIAGEITKANFILTGLQTYPLKTGYQFISSRLIQENPDMLNVLENNLNDNLNFVRNTAGQTLTKIGSNWVNNIGDWVTTEGYLFKMNNEDELIITGQPVNPQTQVNLSAGYQMISYLQLRPNNALELFEGVLDNLDFARNTDGDMLRKIGPEWINSIGDIQAGEALLVKMLANDVLIYPAIFKTCGDPFTDARNGQIYNTVLIGEQCWMAENLNIGEIINGIEEMTDNSIIEKYCYNDSTLNCDTYGGLYQWNEMMKYTGDTARQGICPAGWHLPTDYEWKILEGNVDTQYGVGDPEWDEEGKRGYDAGFNLKAIIGWTTHGNGSDVYEFATIPGGMWYKNEGYLNIGYNARFWTSMGYNYNKAWTRSFSPEKKTFRYGRKKENGLSIRCLKGIYIYPPSSPDPEDGAENQSIEHDISWLCTDPEGNATYDVYFGTADTLKLVSFGQSEITYDPGTLKHNKQYFWKIIVRNIHGNTTEGPLWTFVTVDEGPWECGDQFYDSRNGETYNTTLIGWQCWMAENLNIGKMLNGNEEMANNNIIEKYCYDNDPANCYEFGGLYQWFEMMQYNAMPGTQGICPDDWHIPTDDEWKILEGTVDSQYPIGDPIWNNNGSRGFDAGLNLKSTIGWRDNGNGSDLYDFTALPGGWRLEDGSFGSLLNGQTIFWLSSDYFQEAWYRSLRYSNDKVSRGLGYKTFGRSVRCLKGNQPPLGSPSSPNPIDESENQSIESYISWLCFKPKGEALTYDIYFGTDTTPPLLASGQSETTYNPGVLENSKEYFWKIVAHDSNNNSSEGPLWSFITIVSGPWQCGDQCFDSRNSKTYNTTLIGWQCWMAENLNIGIMLNPHEEMTNNGIIEKFCYYDVVESCYELGGLYKWNEMMQYTNDTASQGICPAGWHLPTDYEWKILEGTVDSQYPVGHSIWEQVGGRGHDAGHRLKSTCGWRSNGNDLYGFTGLPAGFRSTNGNYYYITQDAIFGSSSEYDNNNAWSRGLAYNIPGVYRYNNKSKGNGFSVRCLKDFPGKGSKNNID